MSSGPGLGRDVTPYAALARFPDRTRPLLTHYSGADQRVELSVASVANAVAKAAGLLRDGLGLAPSEATVSIDLPRHWQLPVWTMAALSVGARVGRHLPGQVEVRVIGPGIASVGEPGPDGQVDVEGVRRRAADDVLLSGCDPFGLPVPALVRAEVEASLGGPVIDVGIEARAQPDVFTPEPGAGEAGELVGTDCSTVPWAEAALAHASGRTDGARLWIDERTHESGLLVLSALVPLVLTGSVVIGSGLTAEQAEHVRAVERVSRAG